jgi:hypothetical protein
MHAATRGFAKEKNDQRRIDQKHFLLPRCLEWIETSSSCLATQRYLPDGVSLFG